MASNGTWPGNLYVAGHLQANSMQLPAASVGDGQMDASNPIDTDKQIHRHVVPYAQKNGTDVVTERKGVHIAQAIGEVTRVQACMTTPNAGAATVVVDLYKNGTTVLSGTISLDSGDAAFAVLLASISSAGYVADDVFEVVVTATAGGGTLGDGLTVVVVFEENP